MTEEEAKTKWCPFARDSEENYGSFNRAGGHSIQRMDENGKPVMVPAEQGFKYVYDLVPTTPARTCLCLTSACMAWQSRTVPGDATNRGFCSLIPNQ